MSRERGQAHVELSQSTPTALIHIQVTNTLFDVSMNGRLARVGNLWQDMHGACIVESPKQGGTCRGLLL